MGTVSGRVGPHLSDLKLRCSRRARMVLSTCRSLKADNNLIPGDYAIGPEDSVPSLRSLQLDLSPKHPTLSSLVLNGGFSSAVSQARFCGERVRAGLSCYGGASG
jgi:hypothetical protein